MRCRKCGKENNDGAKFCAYCGTALSMPDSAGIQSQLLLWLGYLSQGGFARDSTITRLPKETDISRRWIMRRQKTLSSRRYQWIQSKRSLT